MNIEVNIGKKEALLFALGIMSFFGIVIVIAYSPSFNGGDAAVFGHSADEMNVKLNGKINSSQQLLENFYGSSECIIDSTELKNKGCPANSYLYKVNMTGNSSCRIYYSTRIISPPSWCYLTEHTTNSNPIVVDPSCGECNQQEVGLVCCISRAICAYNNQNKQYYWANAPPNTICQ